MPTDHACTIACEVKPADHEYGFDPNKRVDHKVQRQVDPFIVYGIDAAGQALEDAGLTDMSEEERYRAGVLDRLGHRRPAGHRERIAGARAKRGRGGSRPHFVHGRLINLISGQVSIKYGLMGPNHAVVTACSTGAHSIGDAARMIAMDDADVMLAGGAEGAICPIGIAGFAQARALSTSFNDEPEKASRPYDRDRDGFVMGEGAGVVVLEEYEHAKARGAKIYAEVVGYGLSGDAYHVTAPHPEGSGALSLDGDGAAQVGPRPRPTSTISTPTAPRPRSATSSSSARCAACSATRSASLSMSSTKSAIGHLLGGAGAVEIDLLHPRDARPDRAADAQPRQSERGHAPASTWCRTSRKKREVKAVLNNSFGFGGTNASLVMKAV